MMVFICSPVFDLGGMVAIHNADEDGLLDFRRRVSRSATLDGSAVFNDFGYSVADRNLRVRFAPLGREVVETLRRMTKTYSRLVVATEEGVFVGAPESFNVSSNEITLNILIERQISA